MLSIRMYVPSPLFHNSTLQVVAESQSMFWICLRVPTAFSDLQNNLLTFDDFAKNKFELKFYYVAIVVDFGTLKKDVVVCFATTGVNHTFFLERLKSYLILVFFLTIVEVILDFVNKGSSIHFSGCCLNKTGLLQLLKDG